MTLLLTDAEVRAAFDWSAAVTALRTAYAADNTGSRFPARGMARGDGSWLRTLSGVPAGSGYMGAKLIAANMRSRRASYLIPLFDEATTELVALLDGHSITGFRTAATSALAADLLAVPGPLRVAAIGSGFEARNHLQALAAIRSLESVHVYSPTPASREAFARELTAEAHDTAEAAVDRANVVICAARSRDETPTFRGEWLRPGMTVVSIGSTLPEQREVDTETLARADLIVADMVEEVLHDTGDVLAARADGIDVTAKTVPLSDSVGRTDADQILLYKSVGSAVQDLAVAVMCLQRAGENGTRLPDVIHPVQK
ncbi:ornithine cyclodeaminase family protein [Actinoplanes subglobosus]|uniref:Ornithine cyclodeaminase family protein n=1 Tax=Actinoplanes subglobosus TaxID=1547892 RepID=A0ABV8IKR4_9ACTN